MLGSLLPPWARADIANQSLHCFPLSRIWAELCSVFIGIEIPEAFVICPLPPWFVLAAPSLPPSLQRNSHPNNPELWVVRNDSQHHAFAPAVPSAWPAIPYRSLPGEHLLHSSVISRNPQDWGTFLSAPIAQCLHFSKCFVAQKLLVCVSDCPLVSPAPTVGARTVAYVRLCLPSMCHRFTVIGRFLSGTTW